MDELQKIGCNNVLATDIKAGITDNDKILKNDIKRDK
jgi:hypothetical protein